MRRHGERTLNDHDYDAIKALRILTEVANAGRLVSGGSPSSGSTNGSTGASARPLGGVTGPLLPIDAEPIHYGSPPIHPAERPSSLLSGASVEAATSKGPDGHPEGPARADPAFDNLAGNRADLLGHYLGTQAESHSAENVMRMQSAGAISGIGPDIKVAPGNAEHSLNPVHSTQVASPQLSSAAEGKEAPSHQSSPTEAHNERQLQHETSATSSVSTVEAHPDQGSSYDTYSGSSSLANTTQTPTNDPGTGQASTVEQHIAPVQSPYSDPPSVGSISQPPPVEHHEEPPSFSLPTADPPAAPIPLPPLLPDNHHDNDSSPDPATETPPEPPPQQDPDQSSPSGPTDEPSNDHHGTLSPDEALSERSHASQSDAEPARDIHDQLQSADDHVESMADAPLNHDDVSEYHMANPSIDMDDIKFPSTDEFDQNNLSYPEPETHTPDFAAVMKVLFDTSTDIDLIQLVSRSTDATAHTPAPAEHDDNFVLLHPTPDAGTDTAHDFQHSDDGTANADHGDDTSGSSGHHSHVDYLHHHGFDA